MGPPGEPVAPVNPVILPIYHIRIRLFTRLAEGQLIFLRPAVPYRLAGQGCLTAVWQVFFITDTDYFTPNLYMNQTVN